MGLWVCTRFGGGAGGLSGFVPGLGKGGAQSGEGGEKLSRSGTGPGRTLLLLWGSCSLGLGTDTGRAT